MAVVAWVATRFMRRLSFPALAIAIILEVVLSFVSSIVSKKEKDEGPENIGHAGQKVQLD